MIKIGDFIKIDYTAYDESGNVFDATKGEVAKSLHTKEGPILIVFGRDKLILGLEEEIARMSKGGKLELTFPPEKAFGSRSKDLIRIMSDKDFFRSEIMPQPGVVVNLDTDQGKLMGVIKSVSGGRVLVDFNNNFKKRLRKVGYLTRDPRMRERKKFGLKRARKSPQWAKR